METALYTTLREMWPARGKVILARYDDETVVVYQAFSQAIAQPSLDAQRMCGAFSMQRMSWIKPNFLWMMYRSGWASKEGQEYVLAVTLRRSGFDFILASAVASSFRASGMPDERAWKQAIARSDVRLQWDPDHGPGGEPLQRRAIQLGLRGEVLRRYVEEWTVRIEDLTPFVREQRANGLYDRETLRCPLERPYPVDDAIAARLGMEPVGS